MSSNPSASPDGPARATPPPAAKHERGAAQSLTMTPRPSTVWAALIAGFLVLIVLLIFVAQNTASVPFAFLGFHWRLQLGVAILLAAVGGGLIAVLAGVTRIYHLRRTTKKQTKQTKARR